METITPGNSWTVGRRLTVEDPVQRREIPLTTATVLARVFSDAAGTTAVGISQITLTHVGNGEYRGVFNQVEVDASLATRDGNDLYEVVWSSDGRYKDVAKLRVTTTRSVPEGV